MNKTLPIIVALLLCKSLNAQEKKQQVTLTVANKTISWADMRLDLGADGLPAMVRIDTGKLFTEPVHFHTVKSSTHKDVKWTTTEVVFSKKQPKLVQWMAKNTSDSLTMTVKGTVKPDGNILYQVSITALGDINLDNVRLHLPFTPAAAKFVRDAGFERTLRPEMIDWKWSNNKKMTAAWLGNDQGGLSFKLTNQKNDASPESWANHGQGGYTVAKKGSAILMDGYSGTHQLKKGEILDYSFELKLNSGTLAAR
jgi:hypothetical protein